MITNSVQTPVVYSPAVVSSHSVSVTTHCIGQLMQMLLNLVCYQL